MTDEEAPHCGASFSSSIPVLAAAGHEIFAHDLSQVSKNLSNTSRDAILAAPSVFLVLPGLN